MSTKPIDFIEKIINAHVCAMNREKASCVLAYVKSEVYSHLLIMVLLLLALIETSMAVRTIESDTNNRFYFFRTILKRWKRWNRKDHTHARERYFCSLESWKRCQKQWRWQISGKINQIFKLYFPLWSKKSTNDWICRIGIWSCFRSSFFDDEMQWEDNSSFSNAKVDES